MKYKLSAAALGIFSMMLASGCASTAVVSRRGVNKVKTAAVISYVENMQFSATNKDTPSFLTTAASAINTVEVLSGEAEQQGSERAQRAYDELRMKIGQTLKWNVLEAQTLRDNSTYSASYTKWLNDQPSILKASIDMAGGAVPGVMWAAPGVGPTMQQRDEIMDALGLDAAIIAQVNYRVGSTSGFSIAGIGNQEKHPQVYVQLKAYARSQEEPIWSDGYAAGQSTEEGVATMTSGIGDHTELFLKAADSGFIALVERFQEALATATN